MASPATPVSLLIGATLDTPLCPVLLECRRTEWFQVIRVGAAKDLRLYGLS